MAGNSSDQQPVASRSGHCRWLTQQMRFLWLNLPSTCGQSSAGHWLQLAADDSSSVTHDCFCQNIRWHQDKIGGGDFSALAETKPLCWGEVNLVEH